MDMSGLSDEGLQMEHEHMSGILDGFPTTMSMDEEVLASMPVSTGTRRTGLIASTNALPQWVLISVFLYACSVAVEDAVQDNCKSNPVRFNDAQMSRARAMQRGFS